MDHILIKYLPPHMDRSSVAWKGEIRCPGKQHEEIHFTFTCPNPEAFTPLIRPFLLAFLVPAMRLGLPLQLEQPIDATTMSNLMEWQEGMTRWHPGKLQVVPIRGDIAPSPFLSNKSRSAGITAFSGGVDSCFTAYRNTRKSNGELFRRTELSAGLMVHGFDIPESQPDTFRSALGRSRRILDSLGLACYELRTDVRRLETVFGCEWEYQTHGILLAAALACLEPYFRRTVIPGTYPYHHMVLPWGSNPVTDPLFASDANPLRHDGAAFDKLDKVGAMVNHPAIQENLRVCWEGDRPDRNCGHCYKCITTQVCFWLNGNSSPACFELPCDATSIVSLRPKRGYDRYLIDRLRESAGRQGMDDLSRQLGRVAGRARRKELWRQIRDGP